MFSAFGTVIRPEWTEGGHLAVGGFLTVFDRATDCFREHAGLGAGYAAQADRGMYVVEAHIAYQREVRAGDQVRVDTLLLGLDPKKLHLFHRMRHEPDLAAAEIEMIVLHVDRAAGRAVPFPDDIMTWLRLIAEQHAREPVPPLVGRVMSLDRRRQA